MVRKGKTQKAGTSGQRSRANKPPNGAVKRNRKVDNSSCPIVGIGGSAGGFEAAMELLRHLPAKNGMAFVIVQHLDPHHTSRLAGLLGKVTDMPVTEITGKTIPQENAVYVQPPNKCVIVKNGALTL